jgi:hypothetical protein
MPEIKEEILGSEAAAALQPADEIRVDQVNDVQLNVTPDQVSEIGDC